MNKTKRKAAVEDKSIEVGNRAMEIAMKALERIDAHEKECGERWAEAIFELKNLKTATDAHAARWEKLAWLVVAAVMVHLISGLF